jgi:selenocysteine-specific elongation factor
MVAVSSVTGEGLPELREAIARASQEVHRSAGPFPFRIAIDRVFTVQGRGTVITGSVVRGCVRAGDTLELLPGGEKCRVRDLQTHGSGEQQLGHGQRAALNLSGVDRGQIERGCELATPGYLAPSHMLDVKLDYLSTCERALKSTQTVRLEIGATVVPVRIVLYEGDRLLPGESAYAQLRGGEPVVSAYGQRFILRDETAARTLGGGKVLRPNAARRRAEAAEAVEALKRLDRGDELTRVEEALRVSRFRQPTPLQVCARAGVEVDAVPRLLEELTDAGRWQRIAGTEVFATPAAMADVAERLVGWLERHHRSHPELPGRPLDAVTGWLERVTGHKALARPVLDEFLERKRVSRIGSFICAPSFAPSLTPSDEKLLSGMIEEIRSGGFQPPGLAELKVARAADRKRLARLATLAVAIGELVPIDAAIYLHAEYESKLRSIVGDLIGRTGGATVSQVRETLNSSRKFAVPFLEYLDRVGYTKRVGDQRVLANPDCRIAK